eukprot:5340326-Amphidinium_carterae.1
MTVLSPCQGHLCHASKLWKLSYDLRKLMSRRSSSRGQYYRAQRPCVNYDAGRTMPPPGVKLQLS